MNWRQLQGVKTMKWTPMATDIFTTFYGQNNSCFEKGFKQLDQLETDALKWIDWQLLKLCWEFGSEDMVDVRHSDEGQLIYAMIITAFDEVNNHALACKLESWSLSIGRQDYRFEQIWAFTMSTSISKLKHFETFYMEKPHSNCHFSNVLKKFKQLENLKNIVIFQMENWTLFMGKIVSHLCGWKFSAKWMLKKRDLDRYANWQNP